jgi:predicted RNA methylase
MTPPAPKPRAETTTQGTSTMPDTIPVTWTDELREVVDQLQYEDRLVFAPKNLPDELQLGVDWIIDAAGGKYNKRDRAYSFLRPNPWQNVYAVVLSNFGYDQKDCVDIQQTPVDVARFIVEKIGVQDMMCMEPSAGEGIIVYQMVAHGATSCRAIEINQQRAKLCSRVTECTHQDFMDLDPERYKTRFDRIVMHPPRTRGQDLAHLQHTLRFCKTGGRIACILPATRKAEVASNVTQWKLNEIAEFKLDTFTRLGKPFPMVCVFLTK